MDQFRWPVCTGALAWVSRFFYEHDDVDFLYGDAEIVDHTGNFVMHRKELPVDQTMGNLIGWGIVEYPNQLPLAEKRAGYGRVVRRELELCYGCWILAARFAELQNGTRRPVVWHVSGITRCQDGTSVSGGPPLRVRNWKACCDNLTASYRWVGLSHIDTPPWYGRRIDWSGFFSGWRGDIILGVIPQIGWCETGNFRTGAMPTPASEVSLNTKYQYCERLHVRGHLFAWSDCL